MEPTYFKQTLTPYEAEAYLKGIEQRGRVSWEQTRMAAYCSLAPWSKDLKPADVMKFAWDGETKTEETREEIEDVIQWATMIATTINKHGE
jgi:hypothetical protein